MAFCLLLKKTSTKIYKILIDLVVSKSDRSRSSTIWPLTTFYGTSYKSETWIQNDLNVMILYITDIVIMIHQSEVRAQAFLATELSRELSG